MPSSEDSQHRCFAKIERFGADGRERQLAVEPDDIDHVVRSFDVTRDVEIELGAEACDEVVECPHCDHPWDFVVGRWSASGEAPAIGSMRRAAAIIRPPASQVSAALMTR